jgi:hypothetical protein
MGMTRFLNLIVLAALLAGCAGLQQFNGGLAPVIEGGRGVNSWLDDLHETRAMPPELLQQTLEAWEQDFRDNPSDNNRMRLVLLLVTAEEPVGDRKRARKLLNGFDAVEGGDSERELVAILQQYLDEQGQSSRKISILWKQVTEQNRRIEELEQQLQALTSIEQHIQQRDKGGDGEDGL